MDMMTRRRAMMGAASGPVVERALYPVGNHSYSPSSANWSNVGNHVVCKTTANSRNWYFASPTTRQSTSFQSTWPTLFTLKAGDEWELTVKNISYTASGSGSNYCNIYLYSKSGTSAIGTQQVSFGSGTGTKPDLTFTGTIAEDSDDIDVNAIRMTVYRAVAPLEFDLYFRVNGVLYLLN